MGTNGPGPWTKIRVRADQVIIKIHSSRGKSAGANFTVQLATLREVEVQKKAVF